MHCNAFIYGYLAPGQDDKIMLILYTNMYVFKVKFGQESRQ